MASPPTSSDLVEPDSSAIPPQPTTAHDHEPTSVDVAAEKAKGEEKGDEAGNASPGADDDDANTGSPESTTSRESGEASPMPSTDENINGPPPLPNEPPPLPNEAPPAENDDGWTFEWDATNQAYYFYNRITGETTWENPRMASNAGASTSAAASAPAPAPAPPQNERLPAGGYNPAIHGDYDPNAWYAKGGEEEAADPSQATVDPAAAYAAIGSFNRFTGRWQGEGEGAEHHNDENKSRRQMNAYFDVDAAANAHDGRSLKAERSGKKPSKAELKQFKEKRRAKKEEKRRAWLRD